jgi:hypothetical protein
MGNALSQANEALIRDYLEIATVTDDLDHFSQLITDDCVWIMMPTGHAFKGFEYEPWLENPSVDGQKAVVQEEASRKIGP